MRALPRDFAGTAFVSPYTTIVTEFGLTQHAFLWQNGVMTDLGVLSNDEDSGQNCASRFIRRFGRVVAVASW